MKFNKSSEGSMKKRNKKEGGYTLVEVVLAVVLFSLVAGGFLVLMNNNEKALARSARYNQLNMRMDWLASILRDPDIDNIDWFNEFDPASQVLANRFALDFNLVPGGITIEMDINNDDSSIPFMPFDMSNQFEYYEVSADNGRFIKNVLVRIP
jgi:type II secretory pathway pseudopilin PulG